MKIKKNTLYGIGSILIVIIGIMFFTLNTSGQETQQLAQNGVVQIVKLSVKGSNYILEPSSVKKGLPVRIEADLSNMPGCSRSVYIPSFGISNTFTSSKNSLEFVPDKAGTFNIACSMNMYRGTFNVLESDGSASDYKEQELSAGSSCGGGGCGCGGFQ